MDDFKKCRFYEPVTETFFTARIGNVKNIDRFLIGGGMKNRTVYTVEDMLRDILADDIEGSDAYSRKNTGWVIGKDVKSKFSNESFKLKRLKDGEFFILWGNNDWPKKDVRRYI